MPYKEAYPRIRRRFGKVAGYIQLVRPFTLVAPILAGIFGVLAPVRDLSLNHLYASVYVGLTLALAQGCGQALNQYADIDIDSEAKPYRPIPSGLVTREEALGVSWLLAIFAVGRGFTISVFFGLIVLVLLFFAVFYSLAPLSPRKIHPLINTGWMAVSRGFLPVFAVLSIYGDLGKALPYALLGFLWVMGFQSSKDIPDSEVDGKHGIKTIPNTYGEKGLRVTMTICTAIYTLISIQLKLYIMLTVLPLAIVGIIATSRKSKITENTWSWTAFYTGLGLIFVLIFIGGRLGLLFEFE